MQTEGTKKNIPLSVPQWHALAQEGIFLPVTIFVNGDSMRPLIRRNRDMVTIVPLQRKPKIGDIVLFPSRYEEELYVIHRVWKMKNGEMRTLGDARETPDMWMPTEEAWGRVTWIERDKRRIYMDRGQWYLWGLLWLILFPIRRYIHRCQRIIRRYVDKNK